MLFQSVCHTLNVGSMPHTCRIHGAVQVLSYSATAGDEVEDLLLLLAYIKVGAQHLLPKINSWGPAAAVVVYIHVALLPTKAAGSLAVRTHCMLLASAATCVHPWQKG